MRRTAATGRLLGDLDAKATSRLLESANDIALVLDGEGTILDVIVRDGDLSQQGPKDWRGRAWIQTVTVESREKVAAMLRDAQDAVAQRWRQVNHPTKGGDDLPMSYSAVSLVDDKRTPSSGRIVAFGRDLRQTVALQKRLVESQQAMERDYWRFREAETRYRNLFQTSPEAVLIVDGQTQRVVEANPAAEQLWAKAKARPVGSALGSLFDTAAADRLQELLAAARAIGKREPVRLVLADRTTAVAVSASFFRQEQAGFLLLRLVPEPVAPAPAARGKAAARAAPAESLGAAGAESMLRAFVDTSPDGLVFTDAQGRVLSANRAFAQLAQLSAEDQARGEKLDRWLGRTGVELGVLIGNLRQRGAVGLFVTSMRGEFGATTEVEIAGSVLQPGDGSPLAFAVRDIGRRPTTEDRPLAKVPRSVGQLAELVGRVSLKEIVSETTDLIEQLCIETALEMTRDNRASAAQLLGLSRQSLYVKLRRYGLGDLGTETEH
jgi:transcriptional regulator PpsR